VLRVNFTDYMKWKKWWIGICTNMSACLYICLTPHLLTLVRSNLECACWILIHYQMYSHKFNFIPYHNGLRMKLKAGWIRVILVTTQSSFLVCYLTTSYDALPSNGSVNTSTHAQWRHVTVEKKCFLCGLRHATIEGLCFRCVVRAERI
jgi:hypothetical protein